LTNGVGFYKISERESVVPLERKIILKEKGESPKFFFNFTKPYSNILNLFKNHALNSKRIILLGVITQILKLSMMSPIEINPENYQNLEVNKKNILFNCFHFKYKLILRFMLNVNRVLKPLKVEPFFCIKFSRQTSDFIIPILSKHAKIKISKQSSGLSVSFQNLKKISLT
jgi:hypothetical protein